MLYLYLMVALVASNVNFLLFKCPALLDSLGGNLPTRLVTGATRPGVGKQTIPVYSCRIIIGGSDPI